MISQSAIKAVFENSFKIKNNESCLIITDKIKEPIAREFFNYASKNYSNCHIEVIEPLAENGQEPPEDTADLMLSYDIILLITNKSLSHTKARRAASLKGARIASMPGITEDIINRSLDINYEELKQKTIKLHSSLLNVKRVRVITELGTDITFEVGNRIIKMEGGDLSNKKAFANLPGGEVEFAPINTNGTYIVDASFASLGKLKKPLTLEVSNGSVIKITGERSKELISTLDKVGKKAYLIAELGIGTNQKAKVTGIVLEDEKSLGTCHIALGNNLSYGGSNDIPLHLDGVITKPTIYFDNKKIMNKGILI